MCWVNQKMWYQFSSQLTEASQAWRSGTDPLSAEQICLLSEIFSVIIIPWWWMFGSGCEWCQQHTRGKNYSSNVGSDWVTLSVRIISSPLPPLRVIIEPINLTSRPHTSRHTNHHQRHNLSEVSSGPSPVSLYSGWEVIVRAPPSLHPRLPLTRFELQMTSRRTRRH